MSRTPTPDEIVDEVIAAANISWHDLRARNRFGRVEKFREVADARAAAACIMRDTLGTSLALIARRLGYSCHTSALCAVRRARNKPSVVRIVETAKASLDQLTREEAA